MKPKSLKRLAPQVGLEPTTLRLTAECSTIELLSSNIGLFFSFSQSQPGVSNQPRDIHPCEVRQATCARCYAQAQMTALFLRLLATMPAAAQPVEIRGKVVEIPNVRNSPGLPAFGICTCRTG